MSDQAKKIEEQAVKRGGAPLEQEKIEQQKREGTLVESDQDKIDEKSKQLERSEQAIGESIQRVEQASRKNAEKVLSATRSEIKQHAQDIAKIEDAEEQIRRLVELAQSEDPLLAVKVASHLDNYVLDKVHDRLLEEEVKKILIEKGFLKEI